MNTQIKQIAQRIRGMRDALDVSIAEAAVKCNVPESDFKRYETGTVDIPVGFLYQFAQAFGVDLATIISGEEPHMSTYFVTRKGTGVRVDRTKAYHYRALANGFLNPKLEPFEVTVEPNELPIVLNSHPGHEFNMVLEGILQIQVAGKELVLNTGDSIYFDATKPHGMKALGGKPTKFLAVLG